MVRLLSDRAVSVYAILWCAGFMAFCAGAYFRLACLKWLGLVLLVPFSLYVAIMIVASVVAFLRAVRRGRF